MGIAKGPLSYPPGDSSEELSPRSGLFLELSLGRPDFGNTFFRASQRARRRVAARTLATRLRPEFGKPNSGVHQTSARVWESHKAPFRRLPNSCRILLQDGPREKPNSGVHQTSARVRESLKGPFRRLPNSYRSLVRTGIRFSPRSVLLQNSGRSPDSWTPKSGRSLAEFWILGNFGRSAGVGC